MSEHAPEGLNLPNPTPIPMPAGATIPSIAVDARITRIESALDSLMNATNEALKILAELRDRAPAAEPDPEPNRCPAVMENPPDSDSPQRCDLTAGHGDLHSATYTARDGELVTRQFEDAEEQRRCPHLMFPLHPGPYRCVLDIDHDGPCVTFTPQSSNPPRG